ncbi:meiosis-specific protein MEI4 isoform X2 [Parambassis ranga]|uniref:Meiosis-specific protein MEI4 isoform X2 n=1 Tax=Parambassis ranga TaxID=210632 RepID=A0A6P7HFB4_9TELE|nr:meiosis-specific protein MEI4 isoform X2 [Parambassis ranga]
MYGDTEEDSRRSMENEEGQLTAVGAGRAEWFFMKVKVALAVAVIKTRPRGMSGREHAEAQACTLRRQDESWKERAQGLQQEVLRLRQEMLVAKVTSNAKSVSEAAGNHDRMDDNSQDLFGPESAEPPGDSGSETPDLLLQDSEPSASVPLPPPPSSLCRRACEDVLFPHVQFLQSLCALHQVSGTSRGLEALWFSPDGDASSVLADTLYQLLHSVVVSCRDPPPPPHRLMLQACRAAARAMDLFCSQRLPSVEFVRRVEEPLRELTGMLLHGHQQSRLQAALTEYLVELGGSSVSKSFLIHHILSEISTLADRLWQAFQGQESSGIGSFPLDEYQNSCHLFWILEELLQKSQVPCRVEVGAEQTGFLSRLEQRVFVLSDEFPLFSISMWRIGGLLRSSDR